MDAVVNALESVLAFAGGVMLVLVVVYLLYAAFLAPEHVLDDSFQFDYPVSRGFKLRLALSPSLMFATLCGDGDTAYKNLVQERIDSQRSNAAQIAGCKRLIERIDAMPKTGNWRTQRDQLERRLCELRDYDRKQSEQARRSTLSDDIDSFLK